MPKKIAQNPWLIFLVTALGVSLVSIDAGIVNLALPSITEQFQASLTLGQWTISGYLLTACALIPLFGRLSDIYSKKFIYLLGFSIFTITSLFCGHASSMCSLIVSRFLQGIGAAMILSNNQAIIASFFPSGKIGRALGINAMIYSVGSILGPSIGGILINYWNWRLIFYLNLPIGVIGVVMGYFILPKTNKSIKKEPFDFLGFILFVFGIVLLLVVIGNSQEWHWSLMKIIFYIGFAVSLLGVFIVWELYTKHPMIDLKLYKITPFATGTFAAFVVAMCFGANNILLPFCLQEYLGFSPIKMGMLLFVPPVMTMLFAPIAGYLADKFNRAKIIRVGLLVFIVGISMEAFIPMLNKIWFIILAQALLGGGNAFFQSPNNSSILTSVPTNRIGIAASIGALVRNFGKTFGIAASVAIFVTVKGYVLPYYLRPAGFVGGFSVVFLLTAVLVLVAMLVTSRE